MNVGDGPTTTLRRINENKNDTATTLANLTAKTPDTKVAIQDGHLIVSIPLQSPTRSFSGKSLTVASTRGNLQTEVQVNGKPVTVGLNAYIKA